MLGLCVLAIVHHVNTRSEVEHDLRLDLVEAGDWSPAKIGGDGIWCACVPRKAINPNVRFFQPTRQSAADEAASASHQTGLHDFGRGAAPDTPGVLKTRLSPVSWYSSTLNFSRREIPARMSLCDTGLC